MSPRKIKIKNTPYKASVGNRLEMLRNQLGLDVKMMAARLSVSKWTYMTYRKGDRIPPLANLAGLIKAHNISLDWLFTGRGNMFFLDVKQESERAAKEAIEAMEAERAEKLSDTFHCEMEEMKDVMQRVPKIRYKVMGYYQQVKTEEKEMLDREPARQDTLNKNIQTPAAINKETKNPAAINEEVENSDIITKEARHAGGARPAGEGEDNEAPAPIKKVSPKIPKGKRKRR